MTGSPDSPKRVKVKTAKTVVAAEPLESGSAHSPPARTMPSAFTGTKPSSASGTPKLGSARVKEAANSPSSEAPAPSPSNIATTAQAAPSSPKASALPTPVAATSSSATSDVAMTRAPSQSILEATAGVSTSAASPGAAKIPGRGSVVLQRRRNNPLQKPIGWNFAPTDSLDPKIHSKHAKRQNIALEISATENSYVTTLKHLYEAFAVPCQLFLPTSDIATMFGNLNEILALHQEFAKAISERVNHWNYSTTISDVFATYIPKMSIYSQYINTYEKGAVLINELAQNRASRFSDLLNVFAELASSHGLDMPAYRINPVQRLPRLCLLLEDLLRNTIEHHPDYSGTRDALAQLKQVSLAVNAAKGVSILREHFESIAQRLSGWQLGTAKACKAPFLNDTRRLVIEDTPMTLYGASRVAPVSLSLFSDGILVARRTTDDGPKPGKDSKGPLEFMEWFPLRDSRLRKIGTTQVSKISKEWSSNPSGSGSGTSSGSSKAGTSLEAGVGVYHWLELQVDEKETFLLGVSELKPWHDWPKKFRETLDELRSKYWSVISQGSLGRGESTSTSGPANSSHPNSPPPCAYGTLTYVSRSSSFVYFGGISNKLLNSFYTYDVRTRQWMTIWPTGGPPPALAKHSACLVGSKIWYYGGLIKNTVTCSNDFYTYDTASNVWEGPITTNGAGPTRGRAGHTMTWLGATSTKLYLLGGATFDDKKQEVIVDDMYEFDTATLKWTQLNSAPVARHGHTAAALEGKLYAWGGRSPVASSTSSSSAGGSSPGLGSALSGSGNTSNPGMSVGGSSPPSSLASTGSSSNLNSTPSGASSTKSTPIPTEFSPIVSVYDFAVRDWTEALNLTGFVPASRQWAASAPVQGRHLLVFGGKRDALLNDMYLLDVNAETWCRYSLPCVLDHRMSSSMQVVEKNGILTVYLFGGLQLNPETMDTTSYSDSFVTFQLHNKYIQQTPKQPTWTNLRPFSVESAKKTGATTGGAPLTSAASAASFNFVSKVAQPTTATVARTESVSTLCTLEAQLSTESKFGETWMAVHSRTHLPFAAKVLKKAQGTADEWKAVGKAVETAQKCKSNHLTTTLGLMDQGSTDSTWILSEYCKHGSVRDYLAAGNKLREPQLQYLAFVMVSALQALNAAGLSHGNLKSSNVLLNDALEFKVADYAFTGALETALKIEPSSSPSNLRQDLIALSTTIIEMAEFSPPFKSLRKKWSSQMEDFVARASMADPEKVITDLDAAFNHPWLKNAKMSEKLQLELADTIKKSFAKESKKRASLVLANSTATTAQPPSPTGQPSLNTSNGSSSSIKLRKEKSTSSTDTNDISTVSDLTSETSDADEVVTLKQQNAVLRKKLRLLKRAYEELKTENAQLKEQIDPSSQGEGTDGEEADSIERANSNPSSLKIKRSSGVRTKDRPSSRKLKVTDSGAAPKEE